MNLLHNFNLIVGRDNVTNLKPHPEHLIYICKQLNVKSDEILIIGDNIRDIEAAINVGAHSIALHTKLAKVETLQIADKIINENEIPLKLIEEIANFFKEQLPHHIPSLIKVVNKFFSQEAGEFEIESITLKEVQKYYKFDKFVWALMYNLRTFDRYVRTKLLR
ncbi:unnamed protein product, partial [marine sediment metagenome]